MSDCKRCDYCDELIEGNCATVRVLSVREYTRRDGSVYKGWSGHDDRDCCPECVAKLVKYERVRYYIPATNTFETRYLLHVIESWDDDKWPSCKKREKWRAKGKARRALYNGKVA